MSYGVRSNVRYSNKTTEIFIDRIVVVRILRVVKEDFQNIYMQIVISYLIWRL